MNDAAYIIGVDIGGTFTDCVAVDSAGLRLHAKVSSTHEGSPVDGVLRGLDGLAEAAGLERAELLQRTSRFGHGTTIGTNLIVERNGARVGLLATRGHGDALFMMRGRGRTAGVANDRILNVRDTDRPAMLVDAACVREIDERVVRNGSVLAPMDEVAAATAIEELLAEGVTAVAICLMWSFRNPSHERRLRELVIERRPDLFVSLSSEIGPRLGEFERTAATVINAYVGPSSVRYLGELESALQRSGLQGSPLIMQSNGGIVPVDLARASPVQTIGSGPAGGLAGTATIARASGHTNVIATDMGGTSFEVGLIVDGHPVLLAEQVIDQHTFRIPQLDLRSIACGGGSIAMVDELSRSLRVGPESAGSRPGPACYGQGDRATVTDADVVLGLIDPDRFLGGRRALDRQRSIDAVAALAEPLGLSVEEAAAGIVRVNSHNAATLIRQRTVQQGLDPRDFALYAYGGAGPVHAFSFAAELGIDEVVCPMGNGASTLSAYGVGTGDVMQVFERQCSLAAPVDVAELRAVVGAVEAEATAAMVGAGCRQEDLRLDRSVLARYAEQFMHELTLPLEPGDLDAASASSLVEVFEQDYARLYGERAVAVFRAIEIFAVRVTASVVESARPGTATVSGSAAAADRQRPVYWPGQGWTDTPVFDRPPSEGVVVQGPALIGLEHTSVTVGPGQRLTADRAGNIILDLTGGQA